MFYNSTHAILKSYKMITFLISCIHARYFPFKHHNSYRELCLSGEFMPLCCSNVKKAIFHVFLSYFQF